MFQQQPSYGNSQPTPIPIHLGAFLKMLRDRHGIAQAEVLQHLPGWHQSAYSKVEKDTRSPTFDQLVPIYNALTQAGVQLSIQDRQQFILLARRKIESRKTRHEHKSDADWEALRIALTEIDQLPIETSKPAPARSSRFTKPLLVESRHLIGREEWLATTVQRLQNPLQKLLVLQGPVGIGKSSELHRLANLFLHSVSRYSVVLCELPPLEQEALGADIALELLLSDILATIGSPYASMPTTGLPARVKYVLESLSRADQSTLILLDNAEQLLDERGELAPVWKRFFTKFVQTGHHATLVLATKEWPTSFVGETQLIQATSVPAFSQAEGIMFLQRLGLQYIAEEHLEQVVETVGGIPLCLEWVARLVREPMLHNDWADFEEEAGSEAMLTQLLEDGSLFDGQIAQRLQPLLDRLVKRLSVEASNALRELAVSPLPLGSPALKTLYKNPAPLKELRDASLLVAYPRRVQLLPMVAASVRSQMSAEQIRLAEDRLIEAFTQWLEAGTSSLSEQGMVVTELALLLLKHRRLLDAAELLIVMGWLSSSHGDGYRLATFAFEVMNDGALHTDLATECGGILLRFYLERIRGEKTSRRERAEEFQRLLDFVTEQKVSFKLATTAHLLQHIIFQDIGESRFVQVHELLDTYLAQIDFQSNADVIDMAVPLLNTKARALNAQSEQEEQQGHRNEANRLREEALHVAQQCIDLLRKCFEVANPAKKTRILYRLARVLNRVGYFLVNLKRGEEAVKVLEESIDIKSQGYVQAGSLAMSLSELGQAYELLGKFQDALRYNAAAMEETQRLAESGHTTAQGDVYVHLVNQARLLLRVGQLEEAERLVNEALPHIRDSRQVYRYKAQMVLEEISHCRAAASTLGREYLDWRWYERYKLALRYDVFAWLTHSGPFSPEEQNEWDSLRNLHDEQSRIRREQLMKASRDREIEIAIREEREPCLMYPAIAIDDVRAHIQALLALSAEIRQQEPNAIVRKLYLEVIEEQVDYLHMVEATYLGDAQAFQEYSRRVHAEPTPEEMEITLGHVLHLIQLGMLQENTAEMSRGLLQDLQRICSPALLKRLQEKESQVGQTEQAEPSNDQVQNQRFLSPAVVKRFFEAVLQEYGFSGWHIQLDHAVNNLRIEANVQTLFLPAYKDISVSRVRELLSHELECHILQAEAGKRSPLALLVDGTRNYLTINEGIAVYYDIVMAQVQNQMGKVTNTTIRFGTLATGLASGVLSTPQTFHHLYQLLTQLYLLNRLVFKKEKNLDKAKAEASRLALNRCLRTYRGVPDLTIPGICYPKDAIYLRGYLQLQQAMAADSEVLDHLMVGRFAFECLPDMQELGITVPSIRSQKYAYRPDLDEYILSFDDSHARKELQDS